MAIILDGVVSGPSGYLNGAQVDAWAASRFTSIPAAGDPPPAGQPDAGPVLSGTNYGGPGQWRMEVPAVAAYYVRVTYPVGATNAKSYWAYDDSLVLTTGAQGAQGVQGYQGTQGTQGYQGTQGTQGVQGSVGFTGPQGFQGSQGPQGNMGAQGVQGTQGTQGRQGFQGYQGLTGPQGAPSTVQGPQGYQGFQGLTGPQGNQGTIGNTGAQGPQGFQGSTGPQGTQGYQGVMGNQGAQGYQGNTGPQGSQGVQGETGAQGPQGYQGNTGPQGAQGNQGSQGVQGAQGFQGTQGFQGAQGNQGSQGVQGAQGFQGTQGSQGNQGTQGVGVPTGGTTGQALIKNSGTNYDTGWQSQLPLAGGTMSGNINMNSVARLTNLLRPSALGQPMRVDESTGILGPGFYTQNVTYGWTVPPDFATGSGAPVNNGAVIQAITVPYDCTVTGVRFYIQTQGATFTANGSQIALMNATTTLAAATTSAATTAFSSAIGLVSCAFSSPTAITAGTYWIVFVIQATTRPTLTSNAPTTTDIANNGQTPTNNSLATTRVAAGPGTMIPAIGSSITGSPTINNASRIFYFNLY